MLQDALPQFVIASFIFFAAGAVKGILGMGLPTLGMGLLGLLMPVSAAATLLVVPSLVTNLWQAAGRGLAATVRRLWLMQLGIVAGTLGAALLLRATDDAFGRRLLGACLLAYGALGLTGWRSPPVPRRAETALGFVAGIATGILTGLTGVFVLPAVPYLQALGLGKDTLPQALGLCFSTSTVALLCALAWQGHLTLQASAGSLFMVLPAVLGMWLGQVVRGGMSEGVFRRSFFGGLAGLGGWLVLR